MINNLIIYGIVMEIGYVLVIKELLIYFNEYYFIDGWDDKEMKLKNDNKKL